MMQQYLATKEQYKDCLLFYRLGDFYEMFFDDAIVASKAIELVLTSRACGDDEKAPMCGVPYHAADTYIARLIEKGYKVAIAEQMADPATCKGIVPRDVIRVVTPGTVVSDTMLSEKESNYLFAVYFDDSIDLSWCDISTGEFCASRIGGENRSEQLIETLVRVQPKEIITNFDADRAPDLWDFAQHTEGLYISCISSRLSYEKSAPGMLLAYLKDTQKQDVTHLEPMRIVDDSVTMRLDKATVKNLEITETLFERGVNGSLLGVLDLCGTAMGSRKMRSWLREPLINIDMIQKRLDAVDALVEDVYTRNNLRNALKDVYDLERLIARISLGTANARDLVALKTSLKRLPDIKAELSNVSQELLDQLNAQIDPLTDICEEIEAAITDDPPFTVREGGLIKPGYSKELDDINDSARDGRKWIAGLEATERERTGIKNLKVGYNKVFGYYIEISKSQTDMAPEDYIRKQTLVGGERYITPELKEVESLVLNAQTKTNDLEYRLFTALRLKIKDLTANIQRSSTALASADVLCSFAEVSVRNNYVKPSVNNKDEIVIKRGRHPVIENTIADGIYVSNDVYIDRDKASMLLITGPNMSGKSTYMRQLALIVLMAQAGCFVPADEASIGICDRIYTRIGASDNISMGQSTFFVEMSELAYILNTATKKSLVILDEIGRGTSTWDGLSIAWAVVEALTRPDLKTRTLFATHYHELTALSESIEGVRNLNVDVAEQNGNIVFLHKIVEGAASRSYGIHVAKLAGVPKSVLEAAQNKLDELESGDKGTVLCHADTGGVQKSTDPAQENRSAKGKREERASSEAQLSLFNLGDSVIAQKLRDLDLMNITPSGAIRLLEELQEEAKKL
ncbi:MAG: DNA mismatch repair protein MutS [Firmicutes bacterium]|nr:DNA mismatch repair protein MutS [Bacillota bacterium]